MLYRYLLLLIAIMTAFVGVQIPNFLTQYQQRLDAQYSEAMVYYRQYQEIASKHFAGDLQRLIDHHRSSSDNAIRESAEPIQTLVNRVELFRSQQRGLQTSYLGQLWFLASQSDGELRESTWRMYSYNVPFTQQALLTGLLLALVVVVVCDLLLSGLGRMLRRLPRVSAR
ncbi:MAG: Uncharacterised protein [Pseudidiomarina mangrovi]|nr:MAG: Uncharacterised protein [Pseudidiomarina mangrovi]